MRAAWDAAQAMEMLHIYVDLVAADAPAEQRYPGVAAYLRACGPCGEDFGGLLAAVRGEALTGTHYSPPASPDRGPPSRSPGADSHVRSVRTSSES